MVTPISGLPVAAGGLNRPGGNVSPIGQIAQAILQPATKGPEATKTQQQGPEQEDQREQNDEYKSPVTAALKQVHGLLGKMGKGLPGFSKVADEQGHPGQGGPGGGLPGADGSCAGAGAAGRMSPALA